MASISEHPQPAPPSEPPEPAREVLDREPPVRVISAQLSHDSPRLDVTDSPRLDAPDSPRLDAAGRRIPQSWPVYLWYLVRISLEWLFGLCLLLLGCAIALNLAIALLAQIWPWLVLFGLLAGGTALALFVRSERRRRW